MTNNMTLSSLKHRPMSNEELWRFATFFILFGVVALTVMALFTPRLSNLPYKVSNISFLNDIPNLLIGYSVVLLITIINFWGLSRLWPWTKLDLLSINFLFLGFITLIDVINHLIATKLGFQEPAHPNIDNYILAKSTTNMVFGSLFIGLALILTKRLNIWLVLVLTVLLLIPFKEGLKTLLTQLAMLENHNAYWSYTQRTKYMSNLTALPVFAFTIFTLWRYVNWQKLKGYYQGFALHKIYRFWLVLLLVILTVLALIVASPLVSILFRSNTEFSLLRLSFIQPHMFISLFLLITLFSFAFAQTRLTKPRFNPSHPPASDDALFYNVLLETRLLRAKLGFLFASSYMMWFLLLIISDDKARLLRQIRYYQEGKYSFGSIQIVPILALLVIIPLFYWLASASLHQQMKKWKVGLITLLGLLTIIPISLILFQKIKASIYHQDYLALLQFPIILPLLIIVLIIASITWMLKGVKTKIIEAKIQSKT